MEGFYWMDGYVGVLLNTTVIKQKTHITAHAAVCIDIISEFSVWYNAFG